jgi:hypothetical protein
MRMSQSVRVRGCPPSALCPTTLLTSLAATVELDKELVPSINAFNLARAILPASKAKSDADILKTIAIAEIIQCR